MTTNILNLNQKNIVFITDLMWECVCMCVIYYHITKLSGIYYHISKLNVHISWTLCLIGLTWMVLLYVVSAGTAHICRFDWVGSFSVCHSHDWQWYWLCKLLVSWFLSIWSLNLGLAEISKTMPAGFRMIVFQALKEEAANLLSPSLRS